MERHVELDLLRRLLDLHGERSTSRSAGPRRQRMAVYADPVRLRREVESVLRPSQTVAALSCDLPVPGTFVTVELADVPVLVTRDDGGGVRAFLNACRHRGSLLAEGRGFIGATLTCPYHGWSYRSDGTLVGRPQARDAFDDAAENAREDTDAGLSCTSLVELPCEEVGGLIVVCTDPAASAVDGDTWLCGLAGEFASHDFARYRFVDERVKRWPFNWKLGIETFMESYHVFTLHRDTLGRQLLAAPMLADFFGPHGRGVVMGRACAELAAKPEQEWTRFHNATLVYWLFPNTVISMPQSGHAELWHFAPAEGRADQCRISVRFYAAPAAPTDEGFWQRLIDFTMAIVENEDFGQQVNIQRTANAARLEEIVFGRNEPALGHFHDQLDNALSLDGAPVLVAGRAAR